MALRSLISIFRSLENKFVALFLVTELVLVASLSFHISRHSGARLDSEMRQRLSAVARSISFSIREELEEEWHVLENLAASPIVSQGIVDRKIRKSYLIPLFERIPLRGINADSLSVGLYGIDMRLIAASDRAKGELKAAPSAALPTPAWFDAINGKPGARLVKNGSTWSAVLAFPVFVDKRVRGVLVERIDSAMLEKVASHQRLKFSLLDGAGVTRLSGRPDPGQSELIAAPPRPAGPGNLIVYEQGDYLHAMLSGQTFPLSPEASWSVDLSIPRAQIHEALRDVWRDTLHVALLLGLPLALLVFWRVRRIMAPLNKLQASMQEIIEHGSIGEHVEILSADQTGRLAETFNQMIDTLSFKTFELVESHRRLEIQRTKALQTAKMAALGEMAGGIAHEINNPLAIIHALASEIQDCLQDAPQDTATPHALARKIEFTAMRIARIINGLRSFSREGTKDPFETVRVRRIVEDTLAFCSERFGQHGVKLIVDEVPEGLQLDCRETQISQVILNLLNNAHDAVEKLPEKWVRLSFGETRDSIAIRISDSGAGIPAAVREKLFQPFFTTKEIGKGTGIGLSVSRGIVADHNGSLTIDDSVPNTCFVALLPKRQAAPVARGPSAASLTRAQLETA